MSKVIEKIKKNYETAKTREVYTSFTDDGEVQEGEKLIILTVSSGKKILYPPRLVSLTGKDLVEYTKFYNQVIALSGRKIQ